MKENNVHPVLPNDEITVEVESDGSNSDESIINSSEAKSQNVVASDSKVSNEDSNNDVLISSHTSAGDESQRDISIGKPYLIFV